MIIFSNKFIKQQYYKTAKNEYIYIYRTLKNDTYFFLVYYYLNSK